MDNVKIIELENEDIEIVLDSCVVLWSEINGNPEKNKALVTYLTKLLEKKVDSNELIESATHTKITYDEKGLVVKGEDLTIEDLPELKLEHITDVTATVEEVNKLHGVLATTNEFNKLHGLLSTTEELNILHGLKTSTAELNRLKGLLITAAELNQLQGIKSNVQKQIDNKQDKLGYKAENQANKVTELSQSTETYPCSKAVYDALKNKQDKLTPEQLAFLNSNIDGDEINTSLEGKVTANEPIEAGTATKVTFDEKGLITGGGKLDISDIPDLPLKKISDVNAKAYELNRLVGLEVESEQINKLKDVKSNVQGQLDDITDLIPEEAASENQLADKQFVENWVNDHAGFFLTKDDKNTPFLNMAELLATHTFYCNGKIKRVSDNDFVVVTADETRNNAVIMYAWIKDDIYNEGHWKYQYKVSNYYDEISFNWGTIIGNISNQQDLMHLLSLKQPNLVNQENIKSVDGNSLLGKGDLTIDKYTKREIDLKLQPIQEDIETAQEDITSLEQDVLELKEADNSIKTRVDNIGSDITSLGNNVNTLQSKVNENTTTVNDMQETVGGLQTATTVISSNVDTLRNDIIAIGNSIPSNLSTTLQDHTNTLSRCAKTNEITNFNLAVNINGGLTVAQAATFKNSVRLLNTVKLEGDYNKISLGGDNYIEYSTGDVWLHGDTSITLQSDSVKTQREGKSYNVIDSGNLESQAVITTLQNNITELQNQVATIPTLQNTISELQTQMTTMQEQITSLQTQLGSVETQVDTINGENV